MKNEPVKKGRPRNPSFGRICSGVRSKIGRGCLDPLFVGRRADIRCFRNCTDLRDLRDEFSGYQITVSKGSSGGMFIGWEERT